MTGYRTLFFAMFSALCILAALALCRTIPGETADKLFATAAWALVGLAAAVAGKSMVGVLAQGSGVKGAVSALLTDAKPGSAQVAGEAIKGVQP